MNNNVRYVGIVSNNSNAPVDKSLLQSIRDTMIHRGPDGSGIWISDNEMIGFGHRRLSIIDLSSNAEQPMSNENNQIWLTFNWEIYNNQELRNKLTQIENHHWNPPIQILRLLFMPIVLYHWFRI